MRKLFIITLLLSSTQFITAQSFRELRALPPFTHCGSNGISHGDVDGDGDEDLFIPGARRVRDSSSLFLNDGTGRFTAVNSFGDYFVYGKSKLIDIDGDLDLDIFYLGHGGLTDSIRFYKNDGRGNFVAWDGGDFPKIAKGDFELLDADRDGDLDIILTGYLVASPRGPYNCLLYLNDGNGYFTISKKQTLEGVFNGSLVVADFDGDSIDDFIVAGLGYKYKAKNVLYLGDGMGSFVASSAFTIENSYGFDLDMATADVDNDGDWDVALTAQGSANSIKLYLNDGAGGFTLSEEDEFVKVQYGNILFSDVDSDGDPDLLISGGIGRDYDIAVLYKNNGHGHFMKDTYSKLKGVNKGSATFVDVDGDRDLDLLTSGSFIIDDKVTTGWATNMYLNDGKGNFDRVAELPFENIMYKGEFAIGDINGDQKDDIIGKGFGGNNYEALVKAFIYDDAGHYLEQWRSPLFKSSDAHIQMVDIDRGQDLDVILSGDFRNSSTNMLWFRNSGDGAFQMKEIDAIQNYNLGNMAFVDVNGDNYPDLITFSGAYSSHAPKLFINDGKGNFNEVKERPFSSAKNGFLAAGDVDRDGDQDVVICGLAGGYGTKIYLNDGSGKFTEDTNNAIEGVGSGAVLLEDINGDSAPDLILAGRNDRYERVLRLYINDGEGVFEEVSSNPFEGIGSCALALGDVTGNGYPDLLVSGRDTKDKVSTKLYLNQGDAVFTIFDKKVFKDLYAGDIEMLDYDGDNDIDILIAGLDRRNEWYVRVYINEGKGLGVHAVDPGQDFSFRVFPNPNEGKGMYLQLANGDFVVLRLTVKNVDGKVLMQHELRVDENEQNVFTPNLQLPAGIYVLELTDGQRACARKVVVY